MKNAIAAVDRLADALDRLGASASRPITLTITPRIPDAALDRALADAAERGQLPQTMQAIQRKVG